MLMTMSSAPETYSPKSVDGHAVTAAHLALLLSANNIYVSSKIIQMTDADREDLTLNVTIIFEKILTPPSNEAHEE
jgi:hypothetical protein